VAAELHRRGAYAVTFAGNMPRIDILASNAEQTRTVMIQVKTKRSGTWQTSTRAGIPREAVPEELRFWVFVDLRKTPADPAVYYIVPEWWIQNNIYEAHSGLPQQAWRCTSSQPRVDSPCDPSHQDQGLGKSMGPPRDLLTFTETARRA
jgi:hypothetical protein